MLNANNNAYDEDGFLPIHKAAAEGNLLALQEQLQQGIDVNVKTEYSGVTPLLLALKHNHNETVKFLLEMRVDVNIKAERFTALSIALKHVMISSQ